MKTLVEIVIFTVLFGGGLGAAIVAAKLYRIRLHSSTFYYLGFIYASLAIDAVLRLWSLADVVEPLPPNFMLKRAIGQGIIGLAVWASVFHFLIQRNGKSKE